MGHSPTTASCTEPADHSIVCCSACLGSMGKDDAASHLHRGQHRGELDSLAGCVWPDCFGPVPHCHGASQGTYLVSAQVLHDA